MHNAVAGSFAVGIVWCTGGVGDNMEHDAESRQQKGASSSGRTGDAAPPDLAGTAYEQVLLALLEGLR